jgi:hypothetical protein
MGFYSPSGDWIEGATVGLRADGSTLSPTVSVEVDAACERVRAGGSALEEMRKLFNAHPLLKADRWNFPENPHPLSALIDLYVEEIYR